MKRIILLVVLLFAVCNAQNIDSLQALNDGPYYFLDSNKVEEVFIKKGKLFKEKADLVPGDFNFSYDSTTYDSIEKIAVISDIHGQYDLAIKLLQNGNVIDDSNNWIFGKNHLVIIGDVMDRGDKVNETFLLIHKLSKQAIENGGRVHFTLGNHEFMVFKNDYRYVNEKYKLVSKLLGKKYKELYGKNSLIGNWLRSKGVILKLNNILFVHGGISKEFLARVNFDINSINLKFNEFIDTPKEEIKKSGLYDIYLRSIGPIWYRGYFKEGFVENDINEILSKTGVQRIIVGHTTQEKIVSLFNGKIIGVDSAIKNGKSGEILIIEKNKLICIDNNGKRREL